MSVIRSLSRVSLQFYPEIKGRVRRVDFQTYEPNVANAFGIDGEDVTQVYWDNGTTSYCPARRLTAEIFYTEEKYPWEIEQEKKMAEVAAKRAALDKIRKNAKPKKQFKPVDDLNTEENGEV